MLPRVTRDSSADNRAIVGPGHGAPPGLYPSSGIAWLGSMRSACMPAPAAPVRSLLPPSPTYRHRGRDTASCAPAFWERRGSGFFTPARHEKSAASTSPASGVSGHRAISSHEASLMSPIRSPWRRRRYRVASASSRRVRASRRKTNRHAPYGSPTTPAERRPGVSQGHRPGHQPPAPPWHLTCRVTGVRPARHASGTRRSEAKKVHACAPLSHTFMVADHTPEASRVFRPSASLATPGSWQNSIPSN